MQRLGYAIRVDPASVAARVTPRTRAILAVDIDGTPCDSAALREVADAHGLWYVADAAQSLGATVRGHFASVEADALVVSFTAGKTVDAGEGGAVLTRHGWLHERLVWHTRHPQRQARDLGLRLTNELAINARIHPAAASDAEAGFDQGLALLSGRRELCFAMLRALEPPGLIEPCGMPGRRALRPASYRLSVAAREDCGHDIDRQLERWLCDTGFNVSVEPSPVGLVYRLPGFPSSDSGPTPCPVAQTQCELRRIIRCQC